jgi:hypothetical protein
LSRSDNKSSSVKKSVSFRQDVYEEAERMADMYFGGNFSAYLTYLICADKYGLARAKQTEEVAIEREEIKKKASKESRESNNFVPSEDSASYIDEILGM